MNHKLNIAISSYRSAPFGGGQGIFVYELSKALQDGIITTTERTKLTKIAQDMNLSQDQIKTLEKKLKEVS